MKIAFFLPPLTVVWALCVTGSEAQEGTLPAPQTALLRCDPGLKIIAVDGSEQRSGWARAHTKECSIVLAPGRHSLQVGFAWSWGDNVSGGHEWFSKQDQSIEFVAVAGRIHRLKDRFFNGEGRDWVIDVTEEEANLPSHGDEHEALDKKARDELGNSILVVRLHDPKNVVVELLRGNTTGIWFDGFNHKLLYNRKDQEVVMLRGEAGRTFAIGNATINGNSFGFDKQRAYTCTDSLMPAFENIPGGRVLYLGSFSYQAMPFGLLMQMSQGDVERVREILKTKDPELAARLEPAPYRLIRIAQPCVIPGRTLLNAERLP